MAADRMDRPHWIEMALPTCTEGHSLPVDRRATIGRRVFWCLGSRATSTLCFSRAPVTLGVRPTPPLSPGIGTYHFSESVNTDWFATLRGRIGYSMDHTLIYATGGAAWANIDFTQMSGPFIGCGGS